MVLDRSGLVMGRTRSADQCAGILTRLLDSFSPARTESVRFRFRVLLDRNDEAVVAAFPLFIEPALVERRLQRVGFRMVDRLHADIGFAADGSVVALPSSSQFSTLFPDCMGHTGTRRSPARIKAILWVGERSITRAGSVLQAASAASESGERAAVLRYAEALAGVPAANLALNSSSDPYTALAAFSALS